MNPKVAEILRAYSVDPSAFDSANTEILSGEVPTSQALAIWQSLRGVFDETKLWPVLRGETRDIEEPPEELLEISSLSNIPIGGVREILATRFREQCEFNAEIVPGLNASESFEDAAKRTDAAGIYAFHGRPLEPVQWKPPAAQKPPSIVKLVQVGGMPRKVSLSLVSVEDPSDVAVSLAFGGWNECPDPPVIAGVLREWCKKYGAVPALISGDILECIVDRPPIDESDCFSLAAEQWVFCSDIVGQGTQSVRKLALDLANSSNWFFWWD